MPARKHTSDDLTDPARMRVLAHPTRLTLLGLLREHGPQTAALLGDVVDEAPGTISYHLGKLAAAGLIAEADAPEGAGRDGREHWWRAASEMTSLDPAALVDDPAAFASAVLLERSFSQMWARSYDEFIDSLPTLDPAWAKAATASDRILHLDVVQAAALRDELTALADRWQALSDDNREADPAGDDREHVALVVQAFRRSRPGRA
jgi:DNA-binding transcriptional ArsR family regulator